MDEIKKLHKDGVKALSLLLLLLLILTFIISHFGLDIRLASYFYDSNLDEWILNGLAPCEWLYRYGTIPGLLVTIIFLVLWASSFMSKRLLSWKRDFLLCFLVIAIGGGVIVNAVLKDHYGRPRPRDVCEFNGNWSYKAPLVPGVPGKGKSFPCGHCAMGFAPVAGFFLYYRSKKIGAISLGTGILYGSLVSITRIGQGAHFLSDALWSLGVLLITGTVLFYFILKPKLYLKIDSIPPVSPKKARFVSIATIAAILIMTLTFLTRRPSYDERIFSLNLNENIKELKISANIEKKSLKILTEDDLKKSKILMEAKGFGFPNADTDFYVRRIIEGETMKVDIKVVSEGYYSERNIKSEIYIPKRLIKNLSIDLSGEK